MALNRRLPMLLAGALLCTYALPTLADEGPEEDYVETCTLEKQQVDGLTCVECSADFQDPEQCSKQHGAEGYAQACRSYGASVWTEIWCKGAPTGQAPANPTPTGDAPTRKASGCQVGAPDAGAWMGWLTAVAMIVMLAGLARRRRRVRAVVRATRRRAPR